MVHDLQRALVENGTSTDDAQKSIRTDLTARLLYSTDASIYQIEPFGVVFPRRLDDLPAVMEICGRYDVPVLARGAGSSLAGQAIGPALIVDCSRYLNRLVKIDPETRTAIVEPGLVLNALNRAASRYGLQFGPDPASAERATLGGSLANNATGAHSIIYGMAADHLLSAEVVLADGSLANFAPVALEEALRRAGFSAQENDSPNLFVPGEARSLESNLYRAALHIREQYAGAIRKNWPRVWRRVSGYNLNYLLPWSPSQPSLWPQQDVDWGILMNSPDIADTSPYPPVSSSYLNLAPLVAGSEGTLAIIRRATVGLVPVPPQTVLGVLAYPSIAQACDAVPGLLEHNPSAVELIPRVIIRLARSVPAYAQQLKFVDQLGGDPAALLIIEFSGDDPALLRERVLALGSQVLLAETPTAQRQVWAVRKVGLGLLMSRAGDIKPWSFIEDLVVPVENLGEFVREMDRIMAAHGTQGNIYAHASAGCLHIRPLLNLKSRLGVTAMRDIAAEAVALTLRLGGSVSGEHGDGLARSEWLGQMFGEEISLAFQELKGAADPKWLLNPGKIVPTGANGELPRMDANLRFGAAYHAKGWETTLDFSRQAGFLGAVEQCNGAGVCRKAEGVMCPSFQATQEEMHSTRGRANLLRAMLSGRFPANNLAEETVYEALDLCLACKGCKAECPSAVDMAKLKYEFVQQYYRRHRRKLRDYLFAYIDLLGRFGHRFAPLVNPLLKISEHALLGKAAERLLGLSRHRSLPALQLKSFQQLASRLTFSKNPIPDQEQVLFLSDAFTEFFQPEAGMAALRALQAAGCQVHFLPVIGAGRTLISKGFLEAAKKHAARLVDAIQDIDPEGKMAVVGVEPSEIFTLRDEYLDLLPGDHRVKRLADRAYMIDEFLVRPGENGEKRILRIANKGQPDSGINKGNVLLHGHCYQKAQPPAPDGYPSGVLATVAMLEAAGYHVSSVDSGCCGMAGAFGYEAEHYEVSMKVGELSLLPAVRQADEEVIVAASGVSCQAQIAEGARRSVVHPIMLI